MKGYMGVLLLITGGFKEAVAQPNLGRTAITFPQKIYRIEAPFSQDSINTLIPRLLQQESKIGFLDVRLDSLKSNAVETQIYLNLGQKYHFKAHLNPPDSLANSLVPLLQNVNPQDGAIVLLDEMAKSGFWLSKTQIDSLQIVKDTLNIFYRLDRGELLPFGGLVWKGMAKTQPQFAEAWLKLQRGKAFQLPLQLLQRRLQESGLFKSVGIPQLKIVANERIEIHVPVSEEAQGTFDLVLGYLPPNGNIKGSLTGNGQIQLRNINGKGYQFGLKLNRNPGSISDFQSHIGASLFLGLPFGFKFQFKGHQRDSTFNQYGFLGEGSYRLGDKLEVSVRVNREFTRPVARIGQDLARTSVWFGGGGFRYAQLNNRINPSNGVLLDVQLAQGRSQRAGGAILQQKLEFVGNGYISPRKRQVLAMGADANALFSPTYLVSDLHTFGGASSMRGYNEARFKAHLSARVFVEYRYQLDAESFAFLFADEGYFQTPAFQNTVAEKCFLTGFGFGLQYGTALGTMQVVYGVNPEEGLNSGKIHFGLAFGL